MRNLGYLSLALILACSSGASDASDGAGGGGAGATSGGGADQGGAGGQGGKKTPESVTSESDCHSDSLGQGGAICVACNPLTVQLSAPVARDGLGATISTSDGAVYEGCDESFEPTGVFCEGDPVNVIRLREGCSGDLSEVSAFDVTVRQDGEVIGAGHFDRLTYACEAKNPSWWWCWEASPVMLDVTPLTR